MNGFQRLREPGPVDQLLAGDEIDVGQSQNGVDELEEAFDAVWAVAEPSSVKEEGERSLFARVMLQEVLRKYLLDGVGILFVEAAVSHGAGGTPDVVQGGHRNLPHSWMREDWAGFDGA